MAATPTDWYTYSPTAEEREANTSLSTNQKLVISAEAGNIEVLQSLMKEPSADVNYRYRELGYASALHCAAFSGWAKVINVLVAIKKGSNSFLNETSTFATPRGRLLSIARLVAAAPSGLLSIARLVTLGKVKLPQEVVEHIT
ncbi:hypothetical protein T484DRAFT_1764040 [Baffinella frigidus]|nr:hypothetical protein T484DRAFT_1764040 [Cryptophyta sp. CCMP2293]